MKSREFRDRITNCVGCEARSVIVGSIYGIGMVVQYASKYSTSRQSNRDAADLVPHASSKYVGKSYVCYPYVRFVITERCMITACYAFGMVYECRVNGNSNLVIQTGGEG